MIDVIIPYIILSIYTLFILNIFFNVILAKFRKKSGTMDLKYCISLLNDLIQLQISLYNENVFEDITHLTQQEFQNYSTQICKDIAESISDDLMDNLTRVMSEDAIYIYISRKVKEFLIQKNKE